VNIDDLREINVKTLQSFKLNEEQRDMIIECLQAGMKMHFDKEECDFISRYISTIEHYDITYLAEVIPPLLMPHNRED
jgi:hypothetical protein